ncbi:MAG: hypothetical protein B6D37_15110 [Sphingobacteriales bacterium UTBCD1]|jgi:hypothetical protein|nr:MAG: hypothetical protein B6D37_15110 [Sphingobacteriales bacterium UTBCD1]
MSKNLTAKKIFSSPPERPEIFFNFLLVYVVAGAGKRYPAGRSSYNQNQGGLQLKIHDRPFS